jgi:hypothetical protein
MTRRTDRGDVGTIWRQEILGSTASYEVVEDLGDIVVVSVREAPGLAPGTRVRLERDALGRMERVDASEPAPTVSARRPSIRRLPASEH